MSASCRLLSATLAPLLLATLSAIACYQAAGATLGLYLGLLVAAVLLTPPAIAIEQNATDRLAALSATVLPLCITWFIASRRNEMWLSEWAASSLVLISFAAALAGLSAALSVTGVGRPLAAAIVILLGLAWLTWPIWLSPTWDGEASTAWVNRFVALHPALAINYPHLGQWVEQSIAYHLTDLNQNVPYAPPHTVLACVLFHLVIGANLLALGTWIERRQRTRELAPPELSARHAASSPEA